MLIVKVLRPALTGAWNWTGLNQMESVEEQQQFTPLKVLETMVVQHGVAE